MASRLFSRQRLVWVAANLLLALVLLAFSPARPWAIAKWRETRVDSVFKESLRTPGDRVEVDRIAQAIGAGGWRRVCVLTSFQDPRELKPMIGELAASVPHDAAMDGSNLLVFVMDDWERHVSVGRLVEASGCAEREKRPQLWLVSGGANRLDRRMGFAASP